MNEAVSVRPLARQDVMEYAEYFAQDNLDVSDRFLSAVQAAFHRLATLPHIGQTCSFADPLLAGLRFWPVPRFTRYLIFYLITEETKVDVLRVLHGARNLEAALKTLSD